MSEKTEGKRIRLGSCGGGIDQGILRQVRHQCFGRITQDLVAKRDIGLYVARVPTDGNPSDGPSRTDFSELERRGARWVTSQPSTLLLSANEWLKDLDRRVSRVAERNSIFLKKYQRLHEHVPQDLPLRSLDNGLAQA